MISQVRISTIFFLVLCLVCAPARAQDEVALRAAETAGAVLYRIDRAAQIAAKESDRSRAFRRDSQVSGWLADVQADAVRIIYVGTEGGVPVALYQVVVDDTGKLRAGLERLESAPLDRRLVMQHAIGERVLGMERTICSNEVEVRVLPAGDGWHAYVLPRAAFPDVYLLGGSYRFELPASGQAVADVQALASECVILQNKPGSGALLFAEDRGLIPNELHVYISRLAGKQLYVTTTPNGRTWLVQDGRIQGVQGIPASAG